MRMFYDKNELTYYIEDEADLATLPENIPEGTIVECLGTELKVFMKKSDGSFVEL